MKNTSTQWRIFSLIAILTTLCSLVNAQFTLTLQPNAADGQDARIWSIQPTTPAGDIDDFIAAYWTWSGDPGILRSLLKFDLSQIPGNATIISAKLSLYYNPTSGSAGQAGANASLLQRVTSSWTESSVTWNTQPTVTTESQVSLATSTSGNQDYPDINIKTFVKYWVNHPTLNYGLMLRLQNETTLFNSMKFASSDYTDAAIRPKLVIVYDTVPQTSDSSICKTIRPDAATGIDARIWSLDPGTNTGTIDDFIAAYWTWSGDPGILRSLIQFDLSSIPSNATVTSAKLSLYYNPTSASAGQAGNNASWLQRVTSPWSESDVTWNNQPTTTTIGQASLPQSTTSNQDYPNINVKNMITYFLAHPSKNYGFMLRLQDETSLFSSMKFASSDYTDASRHPKLKICYTLNESGKENIAHEVELEPTKISAYPNPFGDQLMISLDELSAEWADVSISTIEGNNVFEPIRLSNIQNNETLDLSSQIKDLPSGIYFIRVITDHATIVKKVLKQ